MLRLLLWRLGYEFWNLVAAILSYDTRGLLSRFNPPVNYFAFGANLDPAVLYRRRMRVLGQEEFLLRDHQMRFTQQGPFKGGGFASVEKSPGKVAYGRLLRLSRVDAIRMDYSELLPIFNRHRRITLTQDGKTFFFYQATFPVEGLIPTEEYKGKILQAAEKSELIPPSLLAELRNTPALEKLDLAEGISLFIDDYTAWPHFLHDPLRHYERWCFALFRRTIGLTLVSRLIRMEK
ncbi:MAG: hypothetical protein AAF702_16290 [Chloroflexota bacterium]